MNTQQAQLQNMKTTFNIVRRNALANPMVYGGKYTQKNKKDAYIEYLEGYVIALTKDLLAQK